MPDIVKEAKEQNQATSYAKLAIAFAAGVVFGMIVFGFLILTIKSILK